MYQKKTQVLNAQNPVAIQLDPDLETQVKDYESVGLLKLIETLYPVQDEEHPEKKTLFICGNDPDDGVAEVVPLYLTQMQKAEIYVAYPTREMPEEHVFGRLDVLEGDQVVATRYFIDRAHLEDEEARQGFFTPLTLLVGFASGSQDISALEGESSKEQFMQALEQAKNDDGADDVTTH